MADRFYCPDPPVDGHFVLEGDEARHLGRVMRLGPGDVVELFDGRGFASLAKVVGLEKKRVVLFREGEPLAERETPCRLTLATAVPKGERFDWLIEKATELGVTRLIPLITERSVVVPGNAKLERLGRVIIEAAKQCGRSRLMTLERPTPWTEVVVNEEDGFRLLAHPGGLAAPCWPRARRGDSVILAVGPEGGFTDAEASAGRDAGWTLISLGSTLLRVETAGLAGSSAILALCEG